MKTNPFRSILLAGLFALLASAVPPPPGQGGKATVSARLSTGVVRLGDQVVLDLVVENERRPRILEIPEVDGITIAGPSGPYQTSYMEVIGGRRSSRMETTYKFALRPQREGDFEIPPFRVEAGGETLETRPLRLKVLVDLAGSDLGFLELRPSSTKVVEGQPFTIEVRLGWDASAAVNYADLSLPWWDSLPGAIEIEDGAPPRGSNEVTVNQEFRVPVEEVDGDPDRVVFRLRRSYLPTRAGTLEFQKSFLEFGRVVDGGFFSGRTKRAKYFVSAPPLSLEVIPLPTEGQPFDFSGAVGRIRARASADTRDVIVGDSIKLTVDWTGAGNLEFFEAPDLARLDAFRGFQVYGSTESKSLERRRVVYDLAPLSEDVSEIPAVPLSVFDPEKDEYVVVETRPIPVRVRPLAHAVHLEGEAERAFSDDIEDIDPTPLGRSEDRAARSFVPGESGLFAIALALPAAWLLLRGAVRRRGDPASEAARRRRGALRRLRRRLAASDDGAAQLVAFTDFLSDRTGEAHGAWLGRDPLRWAREHRTVEPRSLEPTKELLDRLEAAAFAGGAQVGREAILAEARRLEGVEL